jgi:hypothetical protein
MLDHMILFQDLVAWCALTRRGLIDLPWNEFREAYIEVNIDDDSEAEAFPTPPAPDTGY